MTFHEYIDRSLGRWSTERRWCDANPGTQYVTPEDHLALAREFCRVMPDAATADFYSLPGDVIAEVTREATPAIDAARKAAMRRLYGPEG